MIIYFLFYSQPIIHHLFFVVHYLTFIADALWTSFCTMIFDSSNSSVSHFRLNDFLNLLSLSALCIETHLYLYFGHAQSSPSLFLLFGLSCSQCSFSFPMDSVTHLFIELDLYSSAMSHTNFHAFFDSLSLGSIMEIYYSSHHDLFYYHFE